jgi:alpha-tubulin suppressor-like RCC1 family protein
VSRFNPRVISSGDDHTIVIDYKNDVYMWGNNAFGQLGLGHPRTVNNVVKMTCLGKNL